MPAVTRGHTHRQIAGKRARVANEVTNMNNIHEKVDSTHLSEWVERVGSTVELVGDCGSGDRRGGMA